MDYAKWPALLEPILDRLNEIVFSKFPRVTYPPPRLPYLDEQSLPQPESPSKPRDTSDSPDLAKVQGRPLPPVPPFASSTSQITDSANQTQDHAVSSIPEVLQQQLDYIKNTLKANFSQQPPHTIQRFSELILQPTRHYKTLPAYLRALDRVISVSSPASIFPLPHALPLPASIIDSSLQANGGPPGVGSGTGGGGILWTSKADPPNASGLSEEDASLGGALLTPIPWLKNGTQGSEASSSPILNSGDPLNLDTPISSSDNSDFVMVPEREDGAVTQGELIRQEQEAGIVPVTQTMMSRLGEDDDEMIEGVEIPQARGPNLVDAVDTGLVDGRNLSMSIDGGVVEEKDKLKNDDMLDIARSVETPSDGSSEIVMVDADESEEDKNAKTNGEKIGADPSDTAAV